MNRNRISTLLLCTLVAACGTDASGTSVPAHPTDQTPATQPTAQPAKRTLTSGNQMPTTPLNLLLDPSFGTVGQDGLTLETWSSVVDDDTFSTAVTMSSTLDSRSPGGHGGGVGILMADGATDKSGDAVMMFAPFLGGPGPFHAQIWASKAHVDGKPMDWDVDPKQLAISITDGGPEDKSYDLAVVPEATHQAGGRTWMLFRTTVDTIAFGGFMIVHTGDKGGQWRFAAPEVTAQPLLDGASTRALRASAHARPRTASERKVLALHASIKPRWVPAAPAAKRTKD
jgi:hypothetical protein